MFQRQLALKPGENEPKISKTNTQWTLTIASSDLWSWEGDGASEGTFLPLGPCARGLPRSSLTVWPQLYRLFSPVPSLPVPWICPVGSGRDAALFRAPPSPLGCSPWSRSQSLAGDFSSLAGSVEGQGVRIPT